MDAPFINFDSGRKDVIKAIHIHKGKISCWCFKFTFFKCSCFIHIYNAYIDKI